MWNGLCMFKMIPRRVYVKIQVPPRTKKSLYKVSPVLLFEMVSLVQSGLCSKWSLYEVTWHSYNSLVILRDSLIFWYQWLCSTSNYDNNCHYSSLMSTWNFFVVFISYQCFLNVVEQWFVQGFSFYITHLLYQMFKSPNKMLQYLRVRSSYEQYSLWWFFSQSTYLLTWLAVGSTLGFIILCLSGLTLCIYGTKPTTTPPRHLSRSVIYKCIDTGNL